MAATALTLDLRGAPAVLDLDRTGSGRVLARDGGYFAPGPGSEWRFEPTPVVGATSMCTDGDAHWVTSSTGLLWCERDGAWTSRFVLELRGAREGNVQVLAHGGGVWLLVGPHLSAVTARGIVKSYAVQRVSGVFRLVRFEGALYVLREDAAWTFAGGVFTPAPPPAALIVPELRAVGAPPRVTARRATVEGVELAVGAAQITSALPNSDGPRRALSTTLAVGDETWRVDGRALEIAMSEAPDLPTTAPVRYAFAAPLVGLTRDAFGNPLLVDRWGTQHVFDGARFDASAAAEEGDVVDAVVLEGEGPQPSRLRLVRARSVADVPLHGHEPPEDRSLLADGAAELQRHLASGITEYVVVRVPAPAAKARAALAGWTRVGRTAAGIALAEMLAGTEDAPGLSANAAVAATFMREIGPSASFFLLEDIAFAAVLDSPTWIVSPRVDRARVLQSFRA